MQDPRDAIVPDMPRAALRNVDVDHCVPLSALGQLLARLVGEPAGEMPPIPQEICLEAAIAAQEYSDMEDAERLGALSPFTCPECQGPLWEIRDGSMLRYRCHVSHALSAESLQRGQEIEVEPTLERLLRLHQQRSSFTRRMAQREQLAGRIETARLLEERAAGSASDAALVGRLIQELGIARQEVN